MKETEAFYILRIETEANSITSITQIFEISTNYGDIILDMKEKISTEIEVHLLIYLRVFYVARDVKWDKFDIRKGARLLGT